MVGTVLDLSDYKRLEAQFRQAQKMEGIGQLAGGVAHDFNNLLTVINGYSEMLLARPDLPAKHLHGLEQIRQAGERATGLTRQLLAFSRRQVFEMHVVELDALVRRSVSLLQPMVGEKYAIEVGGGETVPTVHADAGQIDQVLMNLVVNARDAMPQGGTIRIECRRAEVDEDFARQNPGAVVGEYAVLTVTDQGCGMSEETRARIFEPLFTTKPEGQGTGLGLSTVFGIVKQSGGFISVESESGRGTSLKVHLPALADRGHSSAVA